MSRDRPLGESSLSLSPPDPRVQAVFIGTPDGQHVEVVTIALKSGKHVYSETPMAITLRDCDEIIHVTGQTILLSKQSRERREQEITNQQKNDERKCLASKRTANPKCALFTTDHNAM
jgi:hypothetical protein